MPENTWFVLCSGPSLTPEDLERVRFERESGRCTVVATNSTAFAAPWADYCFAMDHGWLKHYRGQCERHDWEVISSHKGASQYGARYVKGLDGKNSGERAIQYAAQQGGDPIIVLGFDCGPVEGKAHHFGDHPPELQNAKNSQNWPTHAMALAHKLSVRVINCSPHSTSLPWENTTLEQYLGY